MKKIVDIISPFLTPSARQYPKLDEQPIAETGFQVRVILSLYQSLKAFFDPMLKTQITVNLINRNVMTSLFWNRPIPYNPKFLTLLWAILILNLTGACGANTVTPNTANSTPVSPWAVTFKETPTLDVYITANGVSEIKDIEAVNQGSQTWLPDTVALNYRYGEGDDGANWNQDCNSGQGCYEISAFSCADEWVNEHRPTYVTESTATNQTGKFSLRLCNHLNKEPRSSPYLEHFELAHGSEWFYADGADEQIEIRIHILAE